MKKIIIILITLQINNSVLYCMDSLYAFPSASKVIVSMNSRVEKLDEYYLYNYTIKNFDKSEQNIWRILIEVNDQIYTNTVPDNWLSGYVNKQDNSLPVWGFRTYSKENDIKPGEARRNFSFRSRGLPSILKFFVEGDVDLPEFDEEVLEENIEISTFTQNSFQGFLISPSAQSINYSPDDLLWQIKDYTNKSLEQYWITNQSTYDKYSKYLDNAMKFLSKEDTNFTTACLERILKEAVIDSLTTLTSEAFALLYFNSEYLVNQLPEINIPDMFERLIAEIEECQFSGSINNKGIYNSLKKKVENAKKSYEKDNIHSSVQKLKAFQNELRAQKDKHVSIECTEALEEYSEIIIEFLEE